MTAAAASAAARIRRTSTWSLRRRLLVAVVAIFVLLTSAIALASVVTMRAVLTEQLDTQLRDLVDRPGPDILSGPGSVPAGSIVVSVDANQVRAQVLTTGGTSSISSANLQRLIDGVGPSIDTVKLGGSVGDVRAVAHYDQDGGLAQVWAVPMRSVNETLIALTFVIAISVLVAALALIALGDMLIRRALRPLTNVIATTERISQLPLDSGDVEMSNRVVIDDPATEVGRVSESVNRMLEHIESSLESRAASERKVRQFVADASHELRTPLAAVQGYAEITAKHDTALSDDARLSLTRIRAAAERMATLVNDLLLLARLDEGTEMEHGVVDLSLLVVDAVADAQAAGPEHPIALEMPGEPVEVVGDLMRLQQVVANLLANARIHTPAGTRIDVRLRQEAQRAVLEVHDNGPGVPAELQATLFERFVRGDVSRSREAGSSGLGLAIVRAIVRAHGGTIDLASEPGSTVFTLGLPLVDAEPEEPSADEEPEARPRGRGRGRRQRSTSAETDA